MTCDSPAAAKAAGWQPGPRRGRAPAVEGVARGLGVACVGYEGHNGYGALIADVDVHVATGVVHPRRYIIAHDCGPISNPDGLRNQIEGGLLQGTSRALVAYEWSTLSVILRTDGFSPVHNARIRSA